MTAVRLLLRLLAVLLVASTCTLSSCSPQENVCAAKNGATVSGPKNASGSTGEPNCVIDGKVADYGRHHGYAWAFNDTATIITLPEPKTINAVEVILLDIGHRGWTFEISVSGGGTDWTTVAVQETLISGWGLYRFERRTVQKIRIEITGALRGLNSYQIIEVAAWNLPVNRMLTPISRAWQNAEAFRLQVETKLLGVPKAEVLLADSAVFDRAKELADTEHFQTRAPDGTSVLIYRDGDALVLAIDDNGDMSPEATEPDMVEDCLAVDLDRDGVLDRSFDYNDDDGDGVAETMVQKYIHFSNWGGMPFMVLVRDFDQGPFRFWHLEDYTYWQRPCQWKCDFAGDGYFAMFNRRDGTWTPSRENPFCFYNTDNDPLPEETVRVVCNGTQIHSLRYSLNADNDSWEPELYDYDVSITCLGTQQLPMEATTTFTMRTGEETAPFLDWEKARDTMRNLPWKRCLFIWDENDSNTARRKPDRERWEGILNTRYRDFPQEGGPPSGRINDRFELDGDFSGKMQVYYWPADGRMHLFGAEVGTWRVDWDYDDRTDLVIEYADTDDDGLLDERRYDYSDSALEDRRIRGPRRYLPANEAGEVQPIEYSWANVHGFWAQKLQEHSKAAEALLASLEEFAAKAGVTLSDGPMDFYRTATPEECFEIEKLRASRESERFYRDLDIELTFGRLMAALEGQQRETLRRARGWWDRGELDRAAEELQGFGE